MRNSDRWRPSKYAYRRGRLVGSRDCSELSVSSRLVADLTAERLQHLLETFANGVLLDLGCGKVPFYGTYKHRVAEVICADWPGSLHGNEYADIACDANRPLPFRDAVFDTVLATDLLEHIYKPTSLMLEMARILKPGGFLIMNTPFMYGLHETPHDYYRMSSFALRRMISEAGLSEVLIETSGGAGHVIADLVAKRAARLPVIGKPVAILVQAAASWLGGTGGAGGSTPFPISHFAVARKPRTGAC